ncbi:heme biosynthesis protein HemY [Rhizobium sp. BK251]|uniref:heme biosynthesis protein HemY n=1 Tax=Rhizobium sp. BK251 TaxID=2512125 RepID=UPI00104578BE|nr:heme biosynthesis protein HemY [Rhizobium sp. BK251]TCL72775.1 HemY protein [Rhizobium sp. BK251]
MVKLLVFAAVVLGLGYVFSWLADRPGDLTLVWEGQLYETKLIVAASFLIALIAAVMLAWWIIRTVWTSPHSVTRYFRARKRDRGYQALSTGLIAAGAGNALLARKMVARTQGLISADQEPLIHLLEAQAALIEGKHDEARKKFEQMANDPETRELGLRGLYLEAKRLGANEAARQYAESAADKAPYLPWAAQATLEYRCRAGRWDEALNLLDKQKLAHVVEKKEAARLRAVLLTARAGDRLEADPSGARDDALHALKLAPDFVPAALIAARALFREDKTRKASSMLEQIWKSTPHPEIGRTYVRARNGDSAVDRLKRAERLESLKPNNIESLLLVARAALDAQDFPRARTKAEAAARIDAREGAFLLLADIEEAETGDEGRVRHWLAQALRAPRDPAWVADGFVSDKWLPASPVSGRLDAFEWKAPFGQVEGPLEEASATTSVDKALRSLPPVRTTAHTEATDDHRIIELERAAAIAEAARPSTSPPARPASPVPAESEAQPFFGGLPDDPGVRDPKAEPEPKTRLRLF